MSLIGAMKGVPRKDSNPDLWFVKNQLTYYQGLELLAKVPLQACRNHSITTSGLSR